MSIITLQIGQCGNQIGEKLFETIVSDCYDTPLTWSKRALDVQQQLKSLNPNYINESKERFFYENDFELRLLQGRIQIESDCVALRSDNL